MCLVSFSKTRDYSSKQKLDVFAGNPLWAYVNITSQCSHRCRWCYGGFNGNLTEQLSPDEFRMILKKLGEIGILQVTLSGGEPTEHPHFDEFVRETRNSGFMTHVVTHGGTLVRYAPFLAEQNVRQVQVNYQGKRFHDDQHGVQGAYNSQQEGIRAALATGIEVTATVTVGAYNLDFITEIFGELEDAGLSRFRIWESTGRGNPWRKGIEAVRIFETCRAEAARRGFTFVQSYDPQFEGDTGVKCPPMSNLHMHINSRGKLRFCPAVLRDADVADFLTDSSEKIVDYFRTNNRRLLDENGGHAWCVARQEKDAAVV